LNDSISRGREVIGLSRGPSQSTGAAAPDLSAIHPKLQALIPIAKGIAEHLGPGHEVVVHDLRDPDHSLVFLAGNVTGRQPGAPITNLVLQMLRQRGNDTPDLIGYPNRTRDGRNLKASTIFVRDDDGTIIGCVCLNMDLTVYQMAAKLIEQLTSTNDLDAGAGRDAGPVAEYFANDVNEVVRHILEEVVALAAKPVALMDKQDKLEIVRQLEQRGVFLVRGSVDQVAQMLGVSRFTVYNYIDEIRSQNNRWIG